MESIRDSLAEELVKLTAQVSLCCVMQPFFSCVLTGMLFYITRFNNVLVQCEKLRAEAALLPGLRAELVALRRRHSAALELMGERDEEVHNLSAFLICE